MKSPSSCDRGVRTGASFPPQCAQKDRVARRTTTINLTQTHRWLGRRDDGGGDNKDQAPLCNHLDQVAAVTVCKGMPDHRWSVDPPHVAVPVGRDLGSPLRGVSVFPDLERSRSRPGKELDPRAEASYPVHRVVEH